MVKLTYIFTTLHKDYEKVKKKKTKKTIPWWQLHTLHFCGSVQQKRVGDQLEQDI